jgi:nitrate/TMAO reductase-like tetraheme cytochrome c subunit
MSKFSQWLFSLRRPVRWLVLLIILAGVTLSAITVSATTWEYTNSPEFCGTVCHTMPPEYTAYQVSPHARVDCVDCHLGQDSVLLTVPRKAREVNHVINALTQAYEPPIYVKNLRPARDTCEQCHNPEKFSSDTFKEIRRYADDLENTETRNFLVVKTGGGTRREGLGRGIHWHIENEVWYYTDDPVKQTIPYIREVTQDGEAIEYFDVEAGLPPDFADQVSDQLRRMDCIDCHTRISHLFRSPADALDDALARGLIDRDIPEIKKQGVEVLKQNYISTEEGIAAVEEILTTYYKFNYPDYYAQNQETVTEAVEAVKVLFNQTVFPNMNVGWQTHPNNVGHREFPGCFRCHDGKHTSAAGDTIRLECNICHSIPEIVEDSTSAPTISIERENEPDSHLDSNWLARHRYKFDESCMECHDVSNPGGTDNSSFCANSGCHATEWKFVGLDAPAIRQLVEPPQEPGTGVPRAVPHPIGARTDCTICHGSEALLAYPDDHTGYEQNLCTLCHKPTLMTAGEAEAEPIVVPAIPHLVEGHENECLECHGLTEVAPFPENHSEWSTDSCLFCHQVETKPEAATEDEPTRPLIPHAVAGEYEDCLFCHNLEGIRPFTANRTHEAGDLDKCQVCHKQETES